MSDIWVRYNDPKNFTGDRLAFNEPHESVWYPSAAIPYVKDIVYDIMCRVKGERLGGILITKLPAGRQCYPHIDGGWHAKYYDKYAVQLAGHPLQSFNVGNEKLVTKAGDVFQFENDVIHWVENNSPEDRITLIVCIRSDRG
jgi:hypothetical protein